MQAKNVCQDNFMFQKEETSSIENSSPPTGAPKAEATPAAAPAEIKLRLLVQIQLINMWPLKLKRIFEELENVK